MGGLGKKKIIIVLGALVIILAVFIKMSGGSGQTDQDKDLQVDKPVAVKTAAASQGGVSPELSFSGSVVGDREVVLTAKTQGAVTLLGARAGDRVKEGQTVVSLDSDSQSLLTNKSREQAGATGLALDKATADYNRIKELYQQGAVSEAEFEGARLALDSTQAAYNVAQSDSRLAAKLLEDTVVRAPFGGSVSQTFVEEGEMVFPGSRLATLVSDTGLKLKASVSPGQLKLVAPGQEGVFSSTAHPGKEFPCRVLSVSSKANPANLSYEVELALEGNPGELLRSGMFGHVKLKTSELKGAIIPREALITVDRDGRGTLFAVTEGKAYLKTVTTGDSDDKNIIITEGLSPGDKVVVYGQNLLKEGAAVAEGE